MTTTVTPDSPEFLEAVQKAVAEALTERQRLLTEAEVAEAADRERLDTEAAAEAKRWEGHTHSPSAADARVCGECGQTPIETEEEAQARVAADDARAAEAQAPAAPEGITEDEPGVEVPAEASPLPDRLPSGVLDGLR